MIKRNTKNLSGTILKYLLLLVSIFFTNQHLFGQENKLDPKIYEFVLNKTSKLVNQDLKQIPSELTEIEMSSNPNSSYKRIGWIIDETKDEIKLLKITGQVRLFPKSKITRREKIKMNNNLVILLGNYDSYAGYEGSKLVTYYLVSLWLNQIGHQELSKKLLSTLNKGLLSDEIIISSFGNLYFNEMLLAYSHERDYNKAIEFGRIFIKPDYLQYQYRQTAIALADQLEYRKDDFQTFMLPDSITWEHKKKGLSRAQQFNYLLDKIHILNCIQLGQPLDINLGMEQTSIPFVKIKYDSLGEENSTAFKVINPYNEILQMKPKTSEINYFLPYLSDSSYIPTYSYWRDFNSERTVYQYNWVIASLIFKITNKQFFDIKTFNTLSVKDKNKEIEVIRDWCNENKDLSQEQKIVKIMLETKDWKEFRDAMHIASENNYTSIIPILKNRFNDFDSKAYPDPKAEIAKTMFQIGSKENVETVRFWFQHNDNNQVLLYSALFLIKYDSGSYKTAFDTLSNLLAKDDGLTLYPAAMETLLSLNNPKALNLAEGILDKQMFKLLFFVDENYQNIVKTLLLAKSESTFNFLYSGLTDYNKNTGLIGYNKKGVEKLTLNCDKYIWLVQKWTVGNQEYDDEWSLKKRKEYSKDLAKWLTNQFNLIKNDQAYEILKSSNKTEPPVPVLDAPGRR